ncbi:MAG TPA: hypothetical protein DCL77_01910 [Prolixibacteraceae bacterium]|jgi:hypothetical protein|nr:hypothetical protein [Prolixibacteraceae bacterium]
MTSVIINEKTRKRRLILDLMQENGTGEIIGDKLKSDMIFNNTTLKAINKAKEGKTIKCIDFGDYLNEVK